MLRVGLFTAITERRVAETNLEMKKKKNNILIITDMFPPLSTVGVMRTTKFIRYLPDFGWNPVVLTCRHPNDRQDALDFETEQGLPEGLEIHRTFCPTLFEVYNLLGKELKQGTFRHSNWISYSAVRSMLIPDPYIGWYFSAVRQAFRIMRAENISAVYTTSPRETSHLIGRSLKRKFGCVWVTDFRDPWMEKLSRPKKLWFLNRLEESMEKSVLMESDQILVAWKGIADGFLKKNPGLSHKVKIITNGFDEEDFADLLPHKLDQFTLLFTGSMYRELTPEPLFDGFKLAIDQFKEVKDKIKIKLVGRQDSYVYELIRARKLVKYVELIPQMPHKKALSYLIGVPLLVLIIPEGENKCIPNKTFEYLRAGKNLLIIGAQNNDVVPLIKCIDDINFISTRNPTEIATFIYKQYQIWMRTGEPNRVPSEGLLRFERRYLTHKLASILNELVKY